MGLFGPNHGVSRAVLLSGAHEADSTSLSLAAPKGHAHSLARSSVMCSVFKVINANLRHCDTDSHVCLSHIEESL
jgi:hypothetical protein